MDLVQGYEIIGRAETLIFALVFPTSKVANVEFGIGIALPSFRKKRGCPYEAASSKNIKQTAYSWRCLLRRCVPSSIESLSSDVSIRRISSIGSR